ncbi:hypothetical protein [Candidatus Phytoplasma pini]|uniref:hypothetical protein n=1 Tax=Candidatus Phytoplasma pini TaxID=267362 RepID=UPI0011A49882|nr:hypothetical protein [Candidatus Phytoplasma pini]
MKICYSKPLIFRQTVIIILFKKTPNFNNHKINFSEIDKLSLKKYFILSKDNITSFFHITTKTFFLILKNNLEKKYKGIRTKEYYYNCFQENDFHFSVYDEIKIEFDRGVILNNYLDFIQQIDYLIKSF